MFIISQSEACGLPIDSAAHLGNYGVFKFLSAANRDTGLSDTSAASRLNLDINKMLSGDYGIYKYMNFGGIWS